MRLFYALAVCLLALPARAQFPVPVVGPDGAGGEVTEIQATPDGASYVIGSFEGELRLGPGPEPTLVWNAPNPTGFLARFGADGVLDWAYALEARRSGFNDPSNSEAKRITALPDGGVVLLGTLTLGIQIDLDPGPAEVLVTPTGFNSVAYVVRYNADGSFAWGGAAQLGSPTAFAVPMGLGNDGGRVFALIPPASDADPGPGEVQTGAAAIVAMDAASGATAYVQPTSTGGAAELAAGGGSVYVLSSGGTSFTIGRHDAATGAETWTYTNGAGRDILEYLEAGSDGALIAAAELTTSATGIALDPAAPTTITLSRNGNARTALARYTPAGALDWAEAVDTNIGAFGGGIAVEGGEIFASGFGHLRAYAEADGSLLRSLPAEFGTPNLRDIAASGDRLVSYVDPANNAAFEIQGVPDGLPPTLLLQFEQSDLSLVISPPVASEPAATPAALAVGAVRPHPLRQRGEVVVSVDAPAHARLTLVDALGREVARFHDGLLAAGDHPIQVQAGGLAPGLYLLVLDADRQRAARPVVVAR